MKRVLLGFSGGIDSCASVLWLQEKGYDVTAVTFDTTGNQKMLKHAEQVAGKLRVKWFTDDVKDLFDREIVSFFISEYLRGATPSVCARCNTLVKWQRLYEIAERDGFDHIATGHYFRISNVDSKMYVTQAVDKVKDQSYYLWGLTQEILNKAITPMGEQKKIDVKQLLGFEFPARESMGVCFLEGRFYGDFLRSRCKELRQGEVINRQGRVIALHEGYPLYTIGQRRGFPGKKELLPDNMAIISVDVPNNRLIAGSQEELLSNVLIIENFQATDIAELLEGNDIRIKIRGLGRNPDGCVKIRRDSDESLEVTLEDPAWAAAKGQPVVFYCGERVAGGGILREAFNSSDQTAAFLSE